MLRLFGTSRVWFCPSTGSLAFQFVGFWAELVPLKSQLLGFECSRFNAMDISQESEDYIRETFEHSLGIRVSKKTLWLKLLASEDDRRHLQAENFSLQVQFMDFQKRCQKCMVEATMNAHGLRKSFEEKEATVARYVELERYCAKLDIERMVFALDLEKAVETCDGLEKENSGLQDQLQDNSSLQALSIEVKSLQEDKKTLLKNLQRAEEEVKVLFEEKRVMENQNQKIIRQLQRGKERHESDCMNSASASSSRCNRKPRM